MVTIFDYLGQIRKGLYAWQKAAMSAESGHEPEPFCQLNKLRYDDNTVTPDYRLREVRQLYLLRYTYAYAYIYKQAYLRLFQEAGEDFFGDELSVVSLGCGTMIDYWSLVRALVQLGRDERTRLKYRGIDIEGWDRDYRMPRYIKEERPQDQPEGSDPFVKSDAITWLEQQQALDAQVYIFPMSISEFKLDETGTLSSFDSLCARFADKSKPITHDHFAIILTLRGSFCNNKDDEQRAGSLQEAVEKRGFSCRTIDSGQMPDGAIKDLGDEDFALKEEEPNRAKQYESVRKSLHSLYHKCPFSGVEADACPPGEDKADCHLQLTRYPMLSADKVAYRILLFDRRGQ